VCKYGYNKNGQLCEASVYVGLKEHFDVLIKELKVNSKW